ncbi:FHA domain-containing protein [Lacrimispora sp. BS-2]|uniref:FHA domain-containing protein n=1 Tax=Lacrimispora sp. BS-2 TaxID=3151850 RepID=A0AAU7PJ99_9FIRM
MGKDKIRRMRGLILVLVLLMTIPVQAANAGKVVESVTKDEEICLYVQGIDGDIQNVSYQIGTKGCEEIKASRLTDLEIPMQTLVMWDNSLSISRENRTKIQDILVGLVTDPMEYEQFCFVGIGEELSFMSAFTDDYAFLHTMVESTAYEDKDAYIIDNVYETVNFLNSQAGDAYKRIILISDGMDNKILGYTKEELYDQLGKTNYPIYVLGSRNKGHTQELQNLFELSRRTLGTPYVLDEISDTSTILQDIANDRNLVCVTATVPAELRDGGNYNSQLTVQTTAGEYKTNASVKMPFGQEEPGTELKTTAEEATEAEEEPEPATLQEPEPSNKLPDMLKAYWYVIAGVAVLLIALGVVLFLKVGRKTPEFETYGGGPVKGQEPTANRPREIEDTGIVHQPEENDEKTELMFSEKPTILLLTDCEDPSKEFRGDLQNFILIGRSSACNIMISYEKSVSGKHCRIVNEDRRYYVIDEGSSNGTKVDGRLIAGKEEIYSGTVLGLGRLSMKVTIK